MAEENEIVKKSGWLKKLLLRMIKSPVNTVFFITLVYFASQAYIFNPVMTNKIGMFAILGLWVVWFVAKQIFMLLILLGLLGGGAYLYYEYSHQEQRACEESGGYWNSNTQTCEEKLSMWERAKKFFQKTDNNINKQTNETSQTEGEEK